MKHRFTLLVLVMVALTATPFAQEKLDKDVEWKIRREARDNSQIMHTLHFLTDVYGPRLTGSQNLTAAQYWIVK
jgi:carboxypeptidase Q